MAIINHIPPDLSPSSAEQKCVEELLLAESTSSFLITIALLCQAEHSRSNYDTDFTILSSVRGMRSGKDSCMTLFAIYQHRPSECQLKYKCLFYQVICWLWSIGTGLVEDAACNICLNKASGLEVSDAWWHLRAGSKKQIVRMPLDPLYFWWSGSLWQKWRSGLSPRFIFVYILCSNNGTKYNG